MKYEEIKIGQKTEYVLTITETDIELFAEVSGYLNPVHKDEEYAKITMTRFVRQLLKGNY
ncbi:hypothetical protein CEE45_15380 [Candidatus Heimdallarchaeota archaeon B3_Heim]|nr:MAG: hypothetical protein CEE45_15380 [Candidatus Heimdallarchaeota archaeon B3_Heim]